MKNYIVLTRLKFEGWDVDSTHETKAEAQEAIRQILDEGIYERDEVHLVSDLSWKVTTKDKKTHSHKRGNWYG